MKITIVAAVPEPFASPMSPQLLDIAQRVAHPDTQFDFKVLGKGITAIEDGNYYAYHLLAEATMLTGLYELQHHGSDALLLACGFDPALLAARAIVDIPVIGGTESAMHLACTMGDKFAVIVPYQGFQHILLRNVSAYGLKEKLIDKSPIRATTDLDWSITTTLDTHRITEAFLNTARECIADGAEALVFGCWCWPCLLTAAGIYEVDGVPIVDPLVAGVKYAEMMAGLKKANIPWISRKSMYKSPDKERTDIYFSQFNNG